MENYHLIIEEDNTVNNSNSNFVRNILFIVISLLLIFSLMRTVVLGSSSIVSFSDFLEKIINIDSIDFSSMLHFRIFENVGDWGIFNFLQVFINSIGSVFGFIIWLVGGFLNLFYFIVQILSFVFVL